MSRSAALSSLGAMALAALAFCVCGAAAQARVRPHYGGELRMETSEDEAPDFIKLLVTETLTYVDARGDVHPALALRWESQNGDRRWQFRLRPGVQLHSADSDAPLTSALVANAIREALTTAGMEARVHGAGDVLTVEFDKPVPQLAALLADAQFAVGSKDANNVLVGSGPYAIQAVTASRVALVANPNYWGGRRFPEAITVLCKRSARDQALDLAARRTDLVEVPAGELRHAQQERTRLSQIQATELIVLSAEHARGSDAKVRQALSESIDRPALLNFIFQKQGQASGALLPNWITGYGALLPAVHDAAHARQLRAEFLGRAAFTLGYEAGDAELQLLAERIALNAREAGVTVQPVARASDVDWQLRRVTLRTANPAAALTEVLHTLHAPLELDDTSLDAVFRAERAALADYTVLPLLHLNRAWAASERLHDWSSASPLQPLPAESWVESKP